MALLLIGIFIASKIALSDIYYHQAKQYLELDTSDENLAQAFYYSNKAHQLFPSSSTYLELMANIKILQALKKTPEIKNIELMQAKRLYQQALSKSPYWVYNWLGIVETKLLLQEYDQELEQALLKSMELGYYETTVQHQLISQALPSLKLFSQQVQKKLLQLYQTALKSQAHTDHYIQLGKMHNILHLQCLLPDAKNFHPKAQKYCQNFLGKINKSLPNLKQ